MVGPRRLARLADALATRSAPQLRCWMPAENKPRRLRLGGGRLPWHG
jgi:hypothetical protein